MVYSVHDSLIGIGMETTFGTTTTVNTWIGGLVPTADPPDAKADIKTYHNLSSGRDMHVSKAGKRENKGSIPLILQNGRPLLLFFGSEDITDADPVFTHVIPSVASEVTTPIGFTAEFNITSPTDWMRKYWGVVIDSCTLSGRDEGELECKIDYIAKDGENTTTAASTITPLTTQPYMFHEGAVTWFNSIVLNVKSFDLTMKNNMSALYYLETLAYGNAGSVSAFAYGKRSFELVVKGDPTGIQAFTSVGDDNSGNNDFEILYTRGASDTFKIECMDCSIVEARAPLPEEGIVETTLRMIPKSVKITVVDAISQYTVT